MAWAVATAAAGAVALAYLVIRMLRGIGSGDASSRRAPPPRWRGGTFRNKPARRNKPTLGTRRGRMRIDVGTGDRLEAPTDAGHGLEDLLREFSYPDASPPEDAIGEPPRPYPSSVRRVEDDPSELRASVRDDPRTPSKPQRFMNTFMFRRGDLLRWRDRLDTSEALTLRVGIGALDVNSLVVNATPVPEDLLPQEDLWLNVMVTSADFSMRFPGDRELTNAVETRLFLPRDGGPARTEYDSEYVELVLETPAEAGVATLRVTLLYNNTPVQSQRLVAGVGVDDVELQVRTDFTASQSLARVVDIPERTRVTVIANQDPSGFHQLTTRAGGPDGQPLAPSVPFRVGELVAKDAISAIRNGLSSRAPSKSGRSFSELREDLKTLAPLGWKLAALLGDSIDKAIHATKLQTDDFVLQIVLPTGSNFTLPWNLVYDIYLDPQVDIGRVPLCPVVDDLKQGHMLPDALATECPHAGDVSHVENLLCPFGFWGVRYKIEVLTPSEEPKRLVAFTNGTHVAAGLTSIVNQGQLTTHINTLRQTFQQATPTVTVETANTKNGVRDLLTHDLPVAYFLCHGIRPKGAATIALGVGSQDVILPGDFTGWQRVVRATENRDLWTAPQPLVFINACESLAISPEDLTDYLQAFLHDGGGTAAIGTEVKVNPAVAMLFAEQFFAAFLKPGATLASAMHTARGSFLADGNLLGLVYTAYGFADLTASIA